MLDLSGFMNPTSIYRKLLVALHHHTILEDMTKAQERGQGRKTKAILLAGTTVDLEETCLQALVLDVSGQAVQISFLQNLLGRSEALPRCMRSETVKCNSAYHSAHLPAQR